MGRETLRQGHSGNDSGRDLKVKLEMARGRVEVGGAGKRIPGRGNQPKAVRAGCPRGTQWNLSSCWRPRQIPDLVGGQEISVAATGERAVRERVGEVGTPGKKRDRAQVGRGDSERRMRSKQDGGFDS